MNTDVFFFSATGNSFWAAGRIAEALQGRLLPITGAEPVSDASRVIIVSPIYALGLPVPTADFIAELKTDAPVWVVLTYGGAVMGADRAAFDAVTAAGLECRGVFTLKMVETFTVFMNVPRSHVKKVCKKAPEKLGAIISAIREGTPALPRRKKGGRADTPQMREAWQKMGARLHTDDSCTRCGKCARICPAGNITMGENGPVHGDKCIACLACYHRCPAHAVRFGRFKKKFRYFCPLADEGEMEKARG